MRRQLTEAPDARLDRRTLAVLEFDRGRSAADIAGMLGVTRQSVSNWVAAYRQALDPAALADAVRPGRPELLGEGIQALLRRLLGRSPQDLGYPHTSWTVPLLQEQIQRTTGLSPSDDTVRRKLRQMDYAWKRPRYALEPDPQLRGKKRSILRRIRRLPPRSVVLAEDETDLLLFPPLRAGWSPVGQPKRVTLRRRNARRVVFGAMNLRTGYRLLLPRERQRAADFQTFLAEVHDRYRGWQVAMLLDEDPSHTAKGSVRLADELDVELLWLPKRAPELNPMETLWGQGKDIVSADEQYATIEEQVERFLGYLTGLSNQEALHTSGALSADFWLNRVLSKNFCGPA